MTVTLVSRQGDKVVIRRATDGKEFTISPDSLSDQSKALVTNKMKNLDLAYPPLNCDVTIGKRRKYDKGSYYMKQMEITAKITLTNEDYKIPCPPCTMNVIFVGQDQRDTDTFMVLSNQEFKVTPTEDDLVKETEPFVTRYDSDNKGEGNIGGFKYVGYLVVVTGAKNQIVHTKTIYTALKNAMEVDATYATKLKTYPANTRLNKDMCKPQTMKVTPGIIRH